MQLNGRLIGGNQPPYVVAEVSCNHGGDLGVAVNLIEKAKWAGADAVKFQCYTPGSITIQSEAEDFVIKEGPWQGQTLYSLYQRAHTPLDWFPLLFKAARDNGIAAFASVFDEGSVDFLESLGCPAYKIASFEITDTPLIEKAAKTGKPIIISTGMANLMDIDHALHAASSYSSPLFLHCVSGYPTPTKEANLSRLTTLINEYGEAGLSDHSLGWNVPMAATALGACLIEKHLTLSRDIPTFDADFSLEPGEFKTMCHHAREVWEACQEREAKSQESSAQLRRSLYAVEDIKAGEHLTTKNVRSIRPGYGLPPRWIDMVLVTTAAVDIKRGTALKFDMLKGYGDAYKREDSGNGRDGVVRPSIR